MIQDLRFSQGTAEN